MAGGDIRDTDLSLQGDNFEFMNYPTLEEYLKANGVNDYTDQETVRQLARKFVLQNARV